MKVFAGMHQSSPLHSPMILCRSLRQTKICWNRIVLGSRSKVHGLSEVVWSLKLTSFTAVCWNQVLYITEHFLSTTSSLSPANRLIFENGGSWNSQSGGGRFAGRFCSSEKSASLASGWDFHGFTDWKLPDSGDLNVLQKHSSLKYGNWGLSAWS